MVCRLLKIKEILFCLGCQSSFPACAETQVKGPRKIKAPLSNTYAFNTLQWGRDLLVPDSAGSRWPNGWRRLLQWGRDLLVPDSELKYMYGRDYGLLQWGRDLLVPDSLRECAAMMRERGGFNGAGTFWSRIGTFRFSMVNFYHGLQWGRDLLVPDSKSARNKRG